VKSGMDVFRVFDSVWMGRQDNNRHWFIFSWIMFQIWLLEWRRLAMQAE
jgi:hypothetical protein